MKEDIENLIVHYSSIPIALLFCGSVMPEVMAPIQTTVSRVYKGINPNFRLYIEKLASRIYEKAKTTQDTLIKAFDLDKFGPLYLFA